MELGARYLGLDRGECALHVLLLFGRTFPGRPSESPLASGQRIDEQVEGLEIGTSGEQPAVFLHQVDNRMPVHPVIGLRVNREELLEEKKPAPQVESLVLARLQP